MKRLLCTILACLCLIGLLPVQADALDTPWQISPETIQNAPVMEFDYSEYLQQPVFNGIATMDVGDDEYDELEPNDDPDNANLLANGYTVYGSLSATDLLDVYEITLTCDTTVVLVSLADKESLLCLLLDEQGNVLGGSETVETVEGYFIEGLGGSLPAGTYYFVILDENEGPVEYMFYYEEHIHAFQPEITEPTCTQMGYTTYTCECGQSYIDDYVDAVGHSYADDSDTTCDRCGAVRESDDTDDTIIPLPELFTDREWEVLRLTNQERLKMELDPLTGLDKLQQATDIREKEIVELFDHTRPDGSSCFTVAQEVGLTYYSMGENIAAGQTSPSWVMNSWMNSEGHRANILTAGYDHLGVGEVNNHWVQLFLGGTGSYTSISVLPTDPVDKGTTIDEMGLVAVLENDVYGTCYLPIEAAYCQGYDPELAGIQTVTISVLGVSSTFEIDVQGHNHTWTDATCTTPKTCSECGVTEGKALEHAYDENGICSNCGHNKNKVPMYRLYNPYTYEHLLTSNEDEKNQLVKVGWSLDGIAWNAPSSGLPVYRLYNPYDDWHTYSLSQEEIDTLVPLGWKVDGVVCYSATQADAIPVYRLFNPYVQTNYHMLTADPAERDLLETAGWILDGVAWQAVK